MKSYYECIDELDILGAEIHQLHGAPDHAVQVGDLDLDYAMNRGRLLYRQENTPQAKLEPALEFIVSGARGVHSYSLSRAARLVIVQPHELFLRKSEIRKSQQSDGIETSREFSGIVNSRVPFSVLTVTGLRRLTSDVAQFKEKSDPTIHS